jgi:phosphoribosylformylglycinamidine synthase
MILFFQGEGNKVFAVEIHDRPVDSVISKLIWLFGDARLIEQSFIEGVFIGPRREMITPWSTNAVEITQNMGVTGISRIEAFVPVSNPPAQHDPMLQSLYHNLDQHIFSIDIKPDPIIHIDDIAAYNKEEGLALSAEEVYYLEELSERLERQLTDSEIFGFSQVNSEHCRHKIFNGTFIIDGKKMPASLFQLIKLTTKTHPNQVVSAYKDNCAFLAGPIIEQFAPITQHTSDYFVVSDIESVISLKAETHNFPTTVEPFNGAATGTGGEIRDRIGGGKGAFPLAGTAVYMTSYPRLNKERPWEINNEPRKWLYQSPEDILIKASNGASDFGNKFGQPLICGSVLTFEHQESSRKLGYDKVVMLAGGIGYGKKNDSLKDTPDKGDKVILLGGDNYRIGMGGGAVSSVATGEYANKIELNAVQRSNPEMQKRVSNAIRALAEMDNNPVVSIHDHGAGGHLNCLSELVEETGGKIYLNKLPVGDPTLSAKELIGNESQERMGLILQDKSTKLLRDIAERERAPLYEIGETTGDMRFTFKDETSGEKPLDLNLTDMFGNPPKTVMKDTSIVEKYETCSYDINNLEEYLEHLLQLEAVACKDWLTNKVDRSVTGKVAKQQTAGEIQLPLNNLGVTALDYQGEKGVATSIGHAPVAGLVDAVNGSVLSIAEALTNIIWAPLKDGINGISLSANWMWPCKNPGEDARLYQAVKAASDFALGLGINIPTGKDSLSMTQKYKDGNTVISPGTVIISAAGEVTNVSNVVEPVLKPDEHTKLLYISMGLSPFELGGSSFGQLMDKLGTITPAIGSVDYFRSAFNLIQQLINGNKIIAGHDVASGGLITTLLEMTFANNEGGLSIDLNGFVENDLIKLLFSENPAIVIQVDDREKAEEMLQKNGIYFVELGHPIKERRLTLTGNGLQTSLDIDHYRDIWFKTSYLLDKNQSGTELAEARYKHYKHQKLFYAFPNQFRGKFSEYDINRKRRESSGLKAAIIREKGVNGDREMANVMHLSGLDVKDVHMTDLITGRETLEGIQFIVFVGGFSNSDVLGSAKGWAGAFLYNPKAKEALDNFYKRDDTLSLGVCNGCQLMMELNLIHPDHDSHPKMMVNDSGKFESAFVNVDVPDNNSVMLKSLSGSRLAAWVAHGEGKFSLPHDESKYNVAMKFSYDAYPGNPNGSPEGLAGICSSDGRHLALMPHLERSVYPWNWAHYPNDQKNNEITPWVEAFVNARDWMRKYT